ncbi:MAG TPA: hypothetical protein VKD08_09605, partial [Ignavibacteriaceae bacterium]|nr:hypothetical protein [Ignavibacteriaceae bacterium]
MIDPELELHPQAIIANSRKREAKFNFVKSVLLDIFFVFYSLIILDRAIYYKFILNLRYIPFSWNNIFILLIISIIAGYLWTYSRTSLSA